MSRYIMSKQLDDTGPYPCHPCPPCLGSLPFRPCLPHRRQVRHRAFRSHRPCPCLRGRAGSGPGSWRWWWWWRRVRGRARGWRRGRAPSPDGSCGPSPALQEHEEQVRRMSCQWSIRSTRHAEANTCLGGRRLRGCGGGGSRCYGLREATGGHSPLHPFTQNASWQVLISRLVSWSSQSTSDLTGTRINCAAVPPRHIAMETSFVHAYQPPATRKRSLSECKRCHESATM